jgi:hypothetical protein
MTIVSGLRIIDSNAQTGIMWWNWTHIQWMISTHIKKKTPFLFFSIQSGLYSLRPLHK